MSNGSKNVWDYVLVPTVITLVVTLVRLFGELQQWNERLFSRSAGGAGALIGIVWLALIFAVYFAIRLFREGEKPAGKGKPIGLAVLALLMWIGGEMLMLGKQDVKFSILAAAGIVLILAALAVMRLAWPAYFKVLFTYALAARIPVVVIMFLAMKGNWNTHYDAAPPAMAGADFTTRFIQLALLPQLTFWVAFSVILCGLIGLLAVVFRKPAGTA
jgi:hypothetical protein